MQLNSFPNENISKTNRMKVSIGSWRANKGQGTFNQCPGFGKTYESIILLIMIFESNNYKNHKYKDILIVTPSMVITDVWIKELTDHFPYDQNKIKIRTIDALSVDNTDKYYLSIFDEGHKYTSDINYDKILHNKGIFNLVLTGTMPPKDSVAYNRIISFCPIVDVISEATAIAEKWISNYKEYNIRLNMSKQDEIQYSLYTAKITNILQKYKDNHNLFKKDEHNIFETELDLLIGARAGKKFRLDGRPVFIHAHSIRESIANNHGWTKDMKLLDSDSIMINKQFHPDVILNDAKILKSVIDSRNQIMHDNIIKLEAVKEIVSWNIGRGIIFNETIDFSNKLGLVIPNSFVYHSEIPSQPMIDPTTGDYYKMKGKGRETELKIFGMKKIKEILVQMFTLNKLDFIIAAKAINEGLSINAIDLVVNTGGTINTITHDQRAGRAKRIDFDNPNKIVTIINLYFDDFILANGKLEKSRDKAKLIIRQQYAKSNVIWINELSELKKILQASK